MDMKRPSIWDMSHDIAQMLELRKREEEKKLSMCLDQLPESIILKIFSFLRHRELGKVARVSRNFRALAYDSRLWQSVSLRPEYSGLRVPNLQMLLALIGLRFGSTMRYIELPSELITAAVLHELATKCANLKYITLDFSNAMQLHDFNDLSAFPCSLHSMCICLSEVIFLEGFMRRIYSCLTSLKVLHLIGTFETSDNEEESYEVINISKIKAHTPNLRVVNFYGIGFLDDSHIEMLSSNCIHLEVLALNFCLRIKGASFKTLILKCKKLKTLLLQHTGLEEGHMQKAPWEVSQIHELDITSTELPTDCLMDVLNRMPGFTWLSVAYCEFFNDAVLEKLSENGKLNRLRALNISYTPSLSENTIYQFLRSHGHQLEGLLLGGKPKLTENFWLDNIPHIKNVKICALGAADGWFLCITTRVHIDQIIECFAQHCARLERLEIQWDPDTIRFSDKSNKFIDHIRLRCPHLRSFTLSDGEYYEMVKSNFERADRGRVVRTTTNYTTDIVSMLTRFNDLLFN